MYNEFFRIPLRHYVLFFHYVQGTSSWQKLLSKDCMCALQLKYSGFTDTVGHFHLQNQAVHLNFGAGGKRSGAFSHNLQHLPLLKLLQRWTTERKKKRNNIKWSAIDRSEWFIHAEFTQLCFDPMYQISCWGWEAEAARALESLLVFPGECKSCSKYLSVNSSCHH